jgi:cysteine desulfurase
VLLALGHDARLAGRTIRLSLGRFTTADDIDQAAELIKGACASAPAFWRQGFNQPFSRLRTITMK